MAKAYDYLFKLLLI
ncbi:unnamed protein product, partial [Adineta ricciae]